jgi:hypothetical protein
MGYGIAARLQIWANDIWERRHDRRGQGTVEYVGMVVMVTLLVAAVAVAAKGWAPDVGGALKKGLVTALKKTTEPFD